MKSFGAILFLGLTPYCVERSNFSARTDAKCWPGLAFLIGPMSLESELESGVMFVIR